MRVEWVSQNPYFAFEQRKRTHTPSASCLFGTIRRLWHQRDYIVLRALASGGLLAMRCSSSESSSCGFAILIFFHPLSLCDSISDLVTFSKFEELSINRYPRLLTNCYSNLGLPSLLRPTTNSHGASIYDHFPRRSLPVRLTDQELHP